LDENAGSRSVTSGIVPQGSENPAWHPKIRELHGYWRSICPADRRLPGRQHFSPVAIVPLLPNIWLLDVVRNPLRFRYRLVGTRIVDALGGECTGRWLHEAHPEFDPDVAAFSDYAHAAEAGEPRWRRGSPIFMSYVERCTELERIFLPLAEDGMTVDVILAMTLMFDQDGREMI
jgi:hypothetical protein